jgi:hypothetical protein
MAERLDIIISAKDEASPALDKAGSSLGRIGEIAGGIVTSQVLAKVADQLMQVLQVGIKEAMEAEVNFAKLDAIIKSTGGAAGVTTKEMIAMADAFQGVSRFSHDTINEAQTILLTFTNLGKDVLPVAIERAMDMAEVFGMDLPSAAKMLAITLDQPAEGIGRLSRVIGKLDPEIEKTIIGMAEMGDTAGAQAAILDVLNSKFGGVAQTVGVTTDGAFQRLQNRLLDFAEGIGSGITEPVGDMANRIMKDGVPAIDGLYLSLKKVGDLLATSGQGWERIFNAIGSMGNASNPALDIYDPLRQVKATAGESPWSYQNEFGSALPQLTDFLPIIQKSLDTVAEDTFTAGVKIADNWILLDDAMRKAGGGFVGAIDSVAASIYNAKIALTGGVERPTATGNWLLDEEANAAYLVKLDALNKDKDAARATADWYSRRAGQSNFITGGAATGMEIWSPEKGKADTGFNLYDSLAKAFPDRASAMGWQGDFAGQHGGRAAGVTDVRDKMAGDMFFQKYGQAATQGEWEQRYYKGSFEGIDEKGAGLDDMFGKPGTWETLIGEQAKEDKKRVDELSLAFRKALRDDPLPVRVVGTPAGGGGDAATSSLQVEHFSTTLSRSRA